MGLAASQARFLGLTARKSNTEYEGQQVNQQRTALANESASLYSQLTNLSVPTPPDITNYYTTEYSFIYNDTEYTMSSLPTKVDSGYNVAISYVQQVPGFKEVEEMDLGFIPDSKNAKSIELGDVKPLMKYLGLDSSEGSADLNKTANLYENEGAFYYEYVKDNQSHFYKYTPNTQIVNQPYSNVNIKFSKTGDIESIHIPTLMKEDDDPISVSTKSVADDNAYDLAMSTYQKDYSEYEKTMAQINAKTEVLQQQDKTLELRLNQLDTEQNAISTEMDAVQKVIEKNVESTFKTFA